jgi:hypothetical protein
VRETGICKFLKRSAELVRHYSHDVQHSSHSQLLIPAIVEL